jgi:dTDP-4-dehydrorhamnose 3,5-epimerase
MKIIATNIADLLLIEPRLFEDERGYFFESFHVKQFSEAIGSAYCFVQDNHSHSHQGVLRGLHYQIVQPQGKLVRVVQGHIYDVAVDLRPQSRTFGLWQGFELSAKNHLELWIPPGFAHGFLALSPTTNVLYKTTEYYAPEHERTICWNDPTLNITWPKGYEIKLSKKDQQARTFQEAAKEIQLMPSQSLRKDKMSC